MNYTRFIREKGTYNEENIMKPIKGAPIALLESATIIDG